MSRNDWEKGVFTLGTAEFSKFQKNFITAYNAARSRDFQTISVVFEKLVESGKGKRGFDWNKSLEDILGKQEMSYRSGWGDAKRIHKFETLDGHYEVKQLLL